MAFGSFFLEQVIVNGQTWFQIIKKQIEPRYAAQALFSTAGQPKIEINCHQKKSKQIL